MSDNEFRKKEKKKLLIIGIIFLIILLAVVGYTYSFFTAKVTNNSVIAGEVDAVDLKLTVTKIVPNNDSKLIPQLDDYITKAVIGRKGNCIDDNNNTVCQVYQVNVKNLSSSTLYVNGTINLDAKDNPNLKWATITGINAPELVSSVNTHHQTALLNKEKYTANEEKIYYIVVWISETGVYQEDTGEFNGVIIVENAVQTPNYPKIDNSNANAPAYAKNLVPVMYNGTTWVTADTTSSTSEYGWYDYDAKKWANAVLLTETKRNSLTKDANGLYTPGQTIGDTESAGVLAFYVWIPRYKYKVWNINKVVATDTYNAQTKGIDIAFEEGTSTTGGITCNYSYAAPSANAGEPNEKCTNSGDGYYTHPAFTLGNDELTGFWMGKFELSSSSPGTSKGGGESITLTPRILPNVYSWRVNYIESYWKVIKDMQKASNIYGLSTDTTKVDTHMLTNMEWGAVAYLTHSKYGRCTGGTNSTCTEVTINSNSSFKTGYSNSTSYPYTNANGQLASTTGNIYGVYDMSGGAWEYVMGNMSKSNGSYAYNLAYAAGGGTYYTYSGNEKYLTTYAYGTSYSDQTAYNRGRLGDATSEVVTSREYAWYSDAAYIPYSSDPWFRRGGVYYSSGSHAGVFYFSCDFGVSYSHYSSRGAMAVFAT